MTRSPARREALRARGRGAGGGRRARREARDATRSRGARPEAVIHQLTVDPAAHRPAQDRARLRAQRPPAQRGHAQPRRRRAGGRRDAHRRAEHRLRLRARAAGDGARRGATRCIARSRRSRSSARREALAELERTVLGAGGMVLRYGYFYGPGSVDLRATARSGEDVAPPAPADRRRRAAACGRSSTSTTPRAPPSRRSRTARPARLQRRRRRARAGRASGCPALARGARRAAARGACPRWLARLAAGQLRRDDDDQRAGRLQRAGQARARLEARATRAGARGFARRSAERAGATCARPARPRHEQHEPEDALRRRSAGGRRRAGRSGRSRPRSRAGRRSTTAVSPLAPSVRTATSATVT